MRRERRGGVLGNNGAVIGGSISWNFTERISPSFGDIVFYTYIQILFQSLCLGQLLSGIFISLQPQRR